MIIDRLIEHGHANADGRTVADVRVGIGYTAVLLEDGGCGVAYTFRNELGNRCGVLGTAGKLAGEKCEALFDWAREDHRVKAAIGLAAINAALHSTPCESMNGNVIDVLDIAPSETFGMVGDFSPILAGVKKRTENIHVFERNHKAQGEIHPEDAIPEYLPQCDVVVITATSIINHTIESVLAHCGNARQVCIVGPSTPLCPAAFDGYNVTLLAGSRVVDPERLLEVVSQAGGTPAMKPASQQVLVKV